MTEARKVKANRLTTRLICLCVSILGVMFLFANYNSVSIINSAFLLVFFVFSLISVVTNIVYRVYLTKDGIECYYFGKIRCLLVWSKIHQICIVRYFRLSAKTSGGTRIFIIPKGCELYSKERWSGIQYFLKHFNQVIAIDDTKLNRNYLEMQYGKITSYR